MSVELEIEEIIKKNLPEQVGNILKSKLIQADKDAEEVILLENKIKFLSETIKNNESEILQYKNFDIRNNGLNEREIKLKNLEHDLGLRMLRYELESEKSKSEFAKSVALGLVRNTEYRKVLNSNEYGTNDNKSYNNNTTKSEINNVD